ncbi:ParA family protein, partial [Cronobacter sakazakii]|uniref:ParA family protein n=1 Tax=Cronobacter sakazakii TaxID=28141 RepID=UPI000975CCEE
MSRFITWLDVERAVKANFKYKDEFQNLTAILCYASGAEVEFTGDREKAISELKDIFGSSLNEKDDSLFIVLDVGEKIYSFDLILVTESRSEVKVVYPLWKEHAYIDSVNYKQPTPWVNGPKFCAFHSFKGGVGRTTSLMTYASATIENNSVKKILLIDGDLEAPGLTLWLDAENIGDVSFTNFLESLQYSNGDFENTLDFYSKELKKTSINIDGNSKEIFVLPSALSLSGIMDMPVTPDIVSKNINNPYILSDLIRMLGQKLEADAIFIDLRAGFSELSSPLLFDPRIEHFFVTTIAKQSISGISEILSKVNNSDKFVNSTEIMANKPTIILSMLTKTLRKLEVYATAIEEINKAYPSINDDDNISQSIELLEFDFDENLMSISSIKDALSSLKKSTIFGSAAAWVGNFSENKQPLKKASADDESLKRLLNICQSFQFAENTSQEDMLVIDPIRNLAKNFVDTLPNVISIGAKGAGKTFTYLQVSKAKTWKDFISKVRGENELNVNAHILPWISSTNLKDNVRGVVAEQRSQCLDLINAKSSKTLNDTVTLINSALADPDTNWDLFWAELLSSEIIGEKATLKRVNDYLNEIDKSVIILVDGIEDIFFSPEKNETHNAAIRALLNLPNAIAELQSRKIGLICFVRADYVQSAIKQNVNQYVSKYQQFRLEWTSESFLRLAYWICAKSNLIDATEKDAESGSINFLIESLERLWGKKLGRDNSKEAGSARWVFAALCDLNGRLQARDLVRFLKFCAEHMLKSSVSGLKVGAWTDRILAPEAMRKSLLSCSEEKVDEAVKEIRPLEQWTLQLESIPSENKRVPFRPL